MKELQSFGAAGEVTGSCHLLTGDQNDRILIDFGMFQGSDEKDRRNAEVPPIDFQNLSAVALTHGHADHAARLPLLVRHGYQGDVFATSATKELAELVMRDSANIMMQEYKHGGKFPLYEDYDVSLTMERFITKNTGQQFDIGNFTGMFYDAGHISGSVSAKFTEKTPLAESLVASGDLGNDNPDDIHRAKQFINQANIIVMETTYGDKNHEAEDTDDIIREELERVQRDGGTLLVPVFSIAKTQRMLDIIKRIKKENSDQLKDKNMRDKVTNLQNLRVYLDSPMGAKATRIYARYRDQLQDRMREEEDPFNFKGLIIPHTREERKLVDEQRGAKVILAGAGMMDGGRIRHYATKYLSQERTGILFTGYQAEGSLGRQIQERSPIVEIDGEEVPVHAKVTTVRKLSSHAGQDKLKEWVTHPEGVRQVVLVHGDDRQREAFAGVVQREMGVPTVLPQRGEIVDLRPQVAFAAD